MLQPYVCWYSCSALTYNCSIERPWSCVVWYREIWLCLFVYVYSGFVNRITNSSPDCTLHSAVIIAHLQYWKWEFLRNFQRQLAH